MIMKPRLQGGEAFITFRILGGSGSPILFNSNHNDWRSTESKADFKST